MYHLWAVIVLMVELGCLLNGWEDEAPYPESSQSKEGGLEWGYKLHFVGKIRSITSWSSRN